ncbi:regulatory protein, GntR:Bacterial regulatory protein, GntR [Fulvimarina pelagi HTCC2506]|uniref:Regulatory protein, GntR:Bacterial regulatory protein, GntR n=1 Tax=Fulvimarina pelagi HTCC2506 TaxID=314231 RepID=Q0G3X9_9HYPH|nr:FCD domain-containing protein [Fulvimarina pelagi]EAU41702.1 regulatory protein, GntR:Bacterial regulatory protein, GntR [Fulvimarina pelagi HTCC2506]
MDRRAEDERDVAAAADWDEGNDGALIQLRAWLTRHDFPPDTRIPPERELSEILGVSRGDLRKALATLEAEGQLWRHVGKGTFTGSRRIEVMSLADIDRETNPAEVMRTRILIEPIIAREAALNATSRHIEALRRCQRRTQRAATWRQYETADNELHRCIAEAADNRLLLALFDALNAVRRAVVWGLLRSSTDRPTENHHSFSEHDRIIEAIETRDVEGAGREMYHHLRAVERSLLDRDFGAPPPR